MSCHATVKNGNYTKILLDNKKIGWVSNENIE
ncbi:GW dipeptide domain-containing protein [Campylobacter fetus]